MYAELLDRLFATSLRGMKLGLENIQKLDAHFGRPSHSFQVVHVAGSNGKGSVSTKIAKALQSSGKRVGLYTSPHIATFRERIRIDGTMLSEMETALLLQEIFALLDRTDIPATFFEVTTLLAFLAFARQKVDIAVLEVGLGGRLDATNIASPLLSVITSISLEHTDLLGSAIEDIAREKAGIIKPHVPIVAGPRTPSLIETIAGQNKSPYYYVKGTFPSYEEENRAVASKAMQLLALPSSAILEGLASLPPCRLEEVKPRVILDVGHNPDGLEQLFQALHHKYPNLPIRVVCGLSKNKDLSGCLRILQQNAAFIHLTEASNGRAAKAVHLAEILQAQGFSRLSVHETVSDAVNGALSAQTNEILVICGTFFIMAAARQALGIDEPRDPFGINEKI